MILRPKRSVVYAHMCYIMRSASGTNDNLQKAITELIMERFDKAQNNQANGTAGVAEPAPTSNGAVKNEETPEQDDDGTPPQSNKRKASETEDDLSDAESSPAPKKKKKVVKAVFNTDETDEQLAARIQAELNGQVRSTRGGGAKRKPVSKPKKSKKKSASKVGAEDDSDLEGEDGEKPEKEKKGGFHVSRGLLSSRRMLTLPPETHEPLRAPRSTTRRVPTLPPSNRQANLGLRQGARPPRTHRQAQHHLRRTATSRLQERQGTHVHHEQDPREPPIPSRRSNIALIVNPPQLHTAKRERVSASRASKADWSKTGICAFHLTKASAFGNGDGRKRNMSRDVAYRCCSEDRYSLTLGSFCIKSSGEAFPIAMPRIALRCLHRVLTTFGFRHHIVWVRGKRRGETGKTE